MSDRPPISFLIVLILSMVYTFVRPMPMSLTDCTADSSRGPCRISCETVEARGPCAPAAATSLQCDNPNHDQFPCDTCACCLCARAILSPSLNLPAQLICGLVPVPDCAPAPSRTLTPPTPPPNG